MTFGSVRASAERQPSPAGARAPGLRASAAWAPRLRSRLVTVTLAVSVVLGAGLIAWFDYMSQPYLGLGLALLCIVPVAAAAWWLGLLPAAPPILVAAVGRFLADVAPPYASGKVAIAAWDAFSLLAILSFAATSVALVRRNRDHQEVLYEQLSVLLRQSESLARTDSLTGLANSRAFLERLTVDLPRLARSGTAMCLAYLDLDNFKRVNDCYGHSAGDELLRDIAKLIRATVRQGDLPARLGGDEFAVSLWELSPEAAVAVARRLLDQVRRLGGDYPEAQLGASVGIAHLAKIPSSPDEAVRRADVALYAAKAAGKGRVAIVTSDALPRVLAASEPAVVHPVHADAAYPVTAVSPAGKASHDIPAK
jgi:diguanylate cyclase (GGDEF)-like protein